MNAKAAIRSEYARLEAPSYALGRLAKRGTLQKAASIVTAGSTQSRVLQKSVPNKAAKTRMKAPPRTVAAKAVALKPSAKATPKKHDATKAVTSKAGACNAAKSTARSRDVASMPVTNPYEESELDCKPAAIPSKKVSKPDSKPAAINRKKESKPDSKSAATSSSKMVSKPESQQVAVPIIKKRSKATWPPSSSISKRPRISSKDNDVISLADDDSSEAKAGAPKNELLCPLCQS